MFAVEQWLVIRRNQRPPGHKDTRMGLLSINTPISFGCSPDNWGQIHLFAAMGDNGTAHLARTPSTCYYPHIMQPGGANAGKLHGETCYSQSRLPAALSRGIGLRFRNFAFENKSPSPLKSE